MPAAKKSSSRNIKVSKQAVDEAFKALSNWGRWGKDDEIGTLNHITPADVVAASKLIKRGKVFALGMPLGQSGPQRGLFGKRWNPIHTMLATGTDALAGRQGGLLYSDDALNMPIQSATHWDSLGHIFYHDKMYNGHHASTVNSNGVSKLGIEHAKDKLVGRGVLLDIARWKKRRHAGRRRGHRQRRPRCLRRGAEGRDPQGRLRHRAHRADGSLQQAQASGAAMPAATRRASNSRAATGCRRKQVAGVCSDTWGVEVRPNETKDVNQPWHWVVIPAMGLYMGEMFDLKELAEDCAKDKVYEFFFCGAPLIIPGGTGSPINPQAIK